MAESEDKKKISREKFFRIGGSSVAGLAILGIAGNHIYKMFARPEKIFYGNEQQVVKKQRALPSPYRKVSAFNTDAPIVAFELYGGKLYAATAEQITIYDYAGRGQGGFAVKKDVRDIAVYDDGIYVLYPTKIEVYNQQGVLAHQWEACSDESDYCAMTVFEAGVFVTDARNKNICHYTTDGYFKRFINSPEEFIVPSYSFGITNIEGKVYCSNPGRHKIECYNAEGEFISSFGKTGTEQGCFSGCCNPVYLTSTANGDIITSEKGVPRVCCYGRDGKFHATLLDQDALGYGATARDVRCDGDKLFVAYGNIISTFVYDTQFAANTACAECKEDCPLRRNTNI